MKVDTQQIMQEILDKMGTVTKIRTADIPNIDLYMDQVTTFMDEKLKPTVREGDSDEKILTKTMINNYAKNDLLPPPVKKKYTREHMMILVFIYYLKNFLTINDIQVLLTPLTEKYFEENGEIALEEIYETIFSAGDERLNHLKADLWDKYADAEALFQGCEGVSDEDAEYLRLFSYISFLSYDVFIKKMLIERLVDEVTTQKQKDKELAETMKKEKKKSKEDKVKEE